MAAVFAAYLQGFETQPAQSNPPRPGPRSQPTYKDLKLLYVGRVGEVTEGSQPTYKDLKL